MERFEPDSFMGKMLADLNKTGLIYKLKGYDNTETIFNMTQLPRIENGNYITGYNCTYPNTFDFENNFDPMTYINFVGTNRWMAKWFMLAYLICIFGLQHYMKSRTKYNLQVPLFFWNFGLALVSTLGSIRCVQELFQVVDNYGFIFSICFAGKP